MPKSRNGVLIVEHNLSYIDKYNEKRYLKQERLFTLSGFQNTKMLNPHYFGEAKITPKSGDKTRFIVVGGINKNNKNHDLLIKTAQKLSEYNTNFEIIVIGLYGSINIQEELKDIIVIVNKRSFNLYAEMLLRQLALQAGKKGSLQNGLEELKKFLQKNKLATSSDAVIYDGSGLSRDNMLTPRVLVNTLSFMTQSPHFAYYYQSLATPDDRGDLLLLRYFLKPKHQVQDVRIKGGTIDGVKAVAGYVPDKNGNPIAFAMMANNLASKDETLLRIHENIIKQLLQTGQ